MDQLDALNQVAEFHRTFKHPVLEKPAIPAQERCDLRVALLAEELQELQQAIDSSDIVGIADALCDIQYVLSGAVLEFGLGDRFVELFNEVQRSNMSKSCNSREEAEATVRYYTEERGVECYYRATDGHFMVYRKSDNKTLKSINYSPPDLAGILRIKA
jgi:predicted HAD superfamily Cof-like phosphohydrolase